MNKLLGIFTVLFTPSCWITVGQYSKEWDKYLNELMLSYRFERINQHEATINNITVWIENHPYASFSYNSYIPKRITMIRAFDKLLQNEFVNKIESKSAA